MRINDQWKTTLGYTMEDLTRQPFLELIHPDDRQATLDVMAGMATGATTLHFINRYRHKDGSYRQLEWRATPADGVIYASARDITERIKEQEEKRLEQVRMQAIIDSQTNYMLRTDLEGNYTYANNKYIEDFGWIHGGRERIIGTNCLPSISPHHQMAVVEVGQKCIAEPGKIFQIEMDKPLENGTVATTLWDFVCLTDAQGKPVEMQCVGTNITDLKRMEREQIESRSNQLLEMSTPIAQLWDGILLLPLVGIVNAARARSVMMAVLKRIADSQAKVLILDIGGVAVVDTEVANHFVKLAKATRLMGCQCTISGISPAVAQTMIDLGVQIEEMHTTGTMKDALAKSLSLTGVKLVRLEEV